MKATTALGIRLGVPLALALTGALAAPAAGAQILEMNGTWQLNHEKSQGPQDKLEVLTVTVTAQEEHYVIHEVHANGKITDGEYRAKFDGGEYEQTSTPPSSTNSGAKHYVQVKKLFDRVEEVTNLRRMPDGSSSVTGHYIRQFSPDFKTMYDTLINKDGEETAFRVFDKTSNENSAHASTG